MPPRTFLSCDPGSHGKSKIRDVFNANMQDGEIQRKLLKATRRATKAFELAINIEMGIQNQMKISGDAAYTVSNQLANASINSFQNLSKRPRPSTNKFRSTICPNRGYAWSSSHRHNCPARGKNCRNWGITNHFAKVCYKTKNQMKAKPRVKNVDVASSEAATLGTSATVEEQVNQIDTMIRQHLHIRCEL